MAKRRMAKPQTREGRVFLLSPANCSGLRAKMVLSDRAQFDLAVRLRSGDGVALGEVFAFVSGLYFKGKLAYALEFARPPEPGNDIVGSGALVITPTAGLRPAETAVTADAIRAFAAVDIAAKDPRYRRPLLASARALADEIGPGCDVVLLGSIASAKYVEVLTEVFGARLRFPIDFVGRGDMSRGGLLLRCVHSGEELTYVPVEGAVRHGARPPKLAPIRGILSRPLAISGASEPRERATGAERAAKRAPASDRVGESEGRSPSDKRRWR
jgi:hypothetical protein